MIDNIKVIERVRYTLRRKHRSGHRIHSPYVYNLVREIFMKKLNMIAPSDAELTVALCQKGLKYDYSYRVGQFLRYNHFQKHVINPDSYDGEDLVVVTNISDCKQLKELVLKMKESHERSAIVLLGIYRNKECRGWWQTQHELSLDLYRIGIIVYDNNLNKEYFKLKI